MQIKPKRESLVSLLLLSLGIILIWAPFVLRIFSGKTALPELLEHDLGFQWIPFREYARSALREGYFPLWCPYLFAGMPFLAFSHTQVLYPFGFIFYLMEYAKAVNFYYPFHLSLGFLGFYLLATNLGISRFASFLVALSTVLSGKFFYFIHFLPIASSNFWGIWFFYFLVKLSPTGLGEAQAGVPAPLRKGAFKNLIGLALVWALELLGGDIESASYQVFFTPLFFFWLLGRKRIFSSSWLLLLLGMVFGTLLAFAQFLPLFEYSQFFLRRAGYTFQEFQSRVWSYRLLFGLGFPITSFKTIMFQSPAPYLYLGLLSGFFPFFALFSNKRYLGLFLLSVFALLFSFGSLSWLDWFIYHLPFLNRYSTQERSFFLFQIFWALLAGLGIDQALKKRSGALWFFAFSLGWLLVGELVPEIIGLRKILIALSGGFLLTLLVLKRVKSLQPQKLDQNLAKVGIFLVFLLDLYWLAFTTFPKNPRDLYQVPAELKKVQELVNLRGGRALVVSNLGIKDPVLLPHLGLRLQLGTIDGWVTVPPLDYAQFLNLMDPRSLKLKGKKIEEFGFNTIFREGKFLQAETLPLLDLLSLRYFLVRGMNLKFASPYSFAKTVPQTIFAEQLAEEALKIEGSQMLVSAPVCWRYPIYLEPEDGFYLRLIPKGSKPSSFFVISFKSSSGNKLIYARGLGSEGKTLRLNLNHYAGEQGEFIFSSDKISKENPSLILEDPRIENPSRPIQRISRNELEIFENRDAFPEAFIGHNCRWHSEPEEILKELKNFSQWDLAQELILSQESPAGKIVKQVALDLKRQWIDPWKLKEPVSKIKQSPDHLVYRAYLLYPGFFFLNHQYLPGWRAYVDGREWKIEKADYCFRAVFLDKGEHQIEFRYQPISFRIGLFFSVFSIFFLFFLAMLKATGFYPKEDAS